MRQFLGTDGAATIIFLKAPDESSLPKMKDVRRLFGIDTLKYYKGDGWYKDEIQNLAHLLSILDQEKGNSPPWYEFFPTNYLLLPPGTKQQIFFTLTYSSILVEGFDLTASAIQQLNKLIDMHWEIKRWRGAIYGFVRDLQSHAERAGQKQVNDPTILNPNILGIQDLLSGYGDSALSALTNELKQWHSNHKWKL